MELPGKILISGDTGGELIIWNINQLKFCKKIKAAGSTSIFSMAMIGNNRLAANCKEKIFIYDFKKYDKIAEIRNDVHTKEIKHLRFLESKNWFVSTSFDKSVKIWDAATYQCLHTLVSKTLTTTTTSVFLYNESTLLTCGHGGELCFWDLNSEIQEPVYIN